MDFAPRPRIQITSLETRGLLVDISGPLIAFDQDLLQDAIVGHLNAGRRDFILRMSGVTNIDSFGLGQLISVYKLIKANDGTMRISSPSKRVRERLRTTRLDTVFDIFYEETAA
jgi:anti-sigma B factor antagonist